ncbi:type II toxin-antitoxin system VapC family toxin [Paralysiella testudinis]|nr:type II toxin-antitoxin system VapC family toxin [Paralysiella testudinis]
MLDTNMVSHVLKQQAAVMDRLQSVPMASLCISAITHAEISYGLAKKPDAHTLHRAVAEFLLRVAVLPFDEQAAQDYGLLKAGIEGMGKSLAPLDMLIAAHAHSIGATLISNDQAFHKITGLAVQDWTQPDPD